MLRRIRQYVLPLCYTQDLEENIIALLLMRTNRIESMLDARLFTTGRESSVVGWRPQIYLWALLAHVRLKTLLFDVLPEPSRYFSLLLRLVYLRLQSLNTNNTLFSSRSLSEITPWHSERITEDIRHGRSFLCIQMVFVRQATLYSSD